MYKLKEAYLTIITCIISFLTFGLLASFIFNELSGIDDFIPKEDDIIQSQCTHNYDEWQVIVEPTCTTLGDKKRTCKLCNYEETESIETSAHNIEVKVDVEYTCTRDGYHSEICTICGYKEVIIDKAMHRTDISPSVEPTCTGTGLTEGIICTVCGTEIVKQNIVEPTGHTYIPKITPPTCDDDGETLYKCHCGDFYTDNIVPALGHTIVDFPEINPTCTEDGYLGGTYCSVCDEVIEERSVIHAIGHVSVPIPAVSATCITTGLTQGVKCGRCQEILTPQTTIPSKGHTMNIVSSTQGTCTTEGVDYLKCNDCPYTYEEKTDLGEHSWREWVSDGYGGYTRVCSICHTTDRKEYMTFDLHLTIETVKYTDRYGVEHIIYGGKATTDIPVNVRSNETYTIKFEANPTDENYCTLELTDYSGCNATLSKTGTVYTLVISEIYSTVRIEIGATPPRT